MSQTWIIRQTVDLSRSDRQVQPPLPVLCCGDARAHTWEISVLASGEKADLDGWRAVGSFTRMDGSSVVLSGEIAGNVARVTFDRAVYAFSGLVLGRFRLTRPDAEMTLAEASFRVSPNTGEIVFDPSGRLTALPNELAEAVAELSDQIAVLKAARGAPHTAALAAGMQDEDLIYVYTGEEEGYAFGHWYYHDGTTWQDGGPYNATAFRTDATLSLAGQAADAAAAGEVAAELLRLRQQTVGAWRPGLSVGGIHAETGANTSPANNLNRARSDFLPFQAGQRVSLDDGARAMIFFYDADLTFLRSSGEWLGGSFALEECAFFRLLLCAEGVSDFTDLPNDFVRVIEPDSLAERLEAAQKDAGYADLRDRPLSIAPDDYIKFGPASVVGNTATLTAASGGLRPRFFQTASDRVRVEACLRFTAPAVAAFVQYHDAEGAVQSLRQAVEIADGQPFTFTFDAANLSVYAGARDFTVMFNAPSGSDLPYAGTTITVEALTVCEEGRLQRSACYDADFVPMMEKTFAAIDEARNAAMDRSLSFRAPNGDKYALLLGDGGEICFAPHVPRKALFVGNSLLLGMNRGAADSTYAYGMCASGHERDWYWQVRQAILQLNPEAECRRLFGAPLEQMGANTDLETLWSRAFNEFTAAPMCESFTPDLDLIVFQLGDNINTQERLSAFESNFDALMTRVRTASPCARLVWVFGWFNHAFTQETLLRLCRRWGIAAVDLYALRNEEHEAYSGQVCETADGGEGVVSDGWITHPGDAGMAAIAEAVLQALDL